MGQELKEPHQAGAPTGLESNDAALTEQPTNIPTTGLNLTQPARLDLSLPPAELKPLACARHQEKLAAAQRAYRDYFLDVAGDPAAAPLPQALLRLEALPDEAIEQLDRAVAFGERLGSAFASASALALSTLFYEAGRARGIAELAATQHADHLKWQEDMDRALADSLTKGTPYVQLCEIRGEHDRAERARRLYAERGIA